MALWKKNKTKRSWCCDIYFKNKMVTENSRQHIKTTFKTVWGKKKKQNLKCLRVLIGGLPIELALCLVCEQLLQRTFDGQYRCSTRENWPKGKEKMEQTRLGTKKNKCKP
ncbi:hypothetical protein ILYODFUR_031091 [Ilyodon furcidens]|uniref:Uncharacterized protein n=1 Tax=Ilyodon furcidens TaxID=33524 RepID=A0ABV0T1R2_9TELE